MSSTKSPPECPNVSTTQGKKLLISDETKYNNLLLLEDIKNSLSNIISVYKGKDDRAKTKLGPPLDKML